MDNLGPSREQIVSAAISAATDPAIRLVLLTGETGVGKSMLLDTIAGQLNAQRVWGTAALAEVPGSSIAHLVTPTGTLQGMIREVLTKVGHRLCVDDFDKCDPLTQALIERYLLQPDRFVVASTRTHNGQLPDSVTHLAHDPKTRVIPVEAFSIEELQAFAAAELGGQVEAGLAAELWRRTSGNPLYAAQVLHTALEDGTLAERKGVWIPIAPLPVPATLRDAISGRFKGLDAAAVEAAQWLAGLGRVPIDWAELSGRTPAIRRLIDLDIATTSGAQIVFTQQAFGEVIWADTDPLRRREVLREHVAAERRQANPDVIRLAVLSIEVGDEVEVSALLAAARLATGGSDVDAALRLAQAALPMAKGEDRIEATALAADALMQLGRAPEAAALLQGELATKRPGPHAVLLAGLLHVVMTWGLGDEAGATAMITKQASRYPRITPLVREVFGFIEADGLVYAGRAADAVRLTDRLKFANTWRVLGKVTPLGRFLPQVEARVTQSRAHALTQLGRPDEARKILTAGNVGVNLAQLEESIPSWRGNYLMALSHATREAGDPQLGLTHALGCWEMALDTGFVWARAWAACNVAACWLLIGDLKQADLWVRRSIHAARASNLGDCERLSVMLSCVIEGSQGREVDPDFVNAVTHSDTGFLHHQYPIGSAWLAQAQGRIAEADEVMAHGLSTAEQDGAGLAVAFICHEWIRMGRPVSVSDRLRQAMTTGALTDARLALAQGMEAKDPALLATAADLFERHGMTLFAAEAAAAAASHSQGRDAAALTQRATRFARELGSPPTPLLASLDAEGGANDRLTHRERHVAELATRMTNAQIATHLTVSRRTVENHLARAYTKLGISSRRDLPAVLGLKDGTE